MGLRSVEVFLSHDPQSLIPVISSESRLHAILKGHGLERNGELINVKSHCFGCTAGSGSSCGGSLSWN